MGVGIVTILAVIGFYAYGAYGRSQLDQLNVPARIDSEGKISRPESDSFDSIAGIDSPQLGEFVPVSADGGIQKGPPKRLIGLYANMYGGADLHPKYWGDPLRAGTDTRIDSSLPSGYSAASAEDYRRFADPKSRATGLRIPVINVDSDVQELSIEDLGDSRQYETPDNTVGHIPETSDPGELGNGWFFGHLESPFQGEGNVFQRVPEIPQLLRHFQEVGEGAVYVEVDSDSGSFLYEVVATQVMPAEELRVTETDGVYISLVVCVPRLDYSHRLVVTAKLVGVRL